MRRDSDSPPPPFPLLLLQTTRVTLQYRHHAAYHSPPPNLCPFLQLPTTPSPPSFPSQSPASRSPHARPAKSSTTPNPRLQQAHPPPCSPMSSSFWADACNSTLNRPLQTQLDAAHVSCGLTVRRAAVRVVCVELLVTLLLRRLLRIA
jgi:hypothetical protein